MSEAKVPTPRERRMFFSRGFGDGAKGVSAVHLGQPDYMVGHDAGRAAKRDALLAYCIQHSLPHTGLQPPLSAAERADLFEMSTGSILLGANR